MKNVAIVTGAAGNLGQAIVQKLLNEKYSVVGTITGKPAPLPFTTHANFQSAVVDLADVESVENFISNVIATCQRIDVLILTAGGFASGSIADTTIGDIQQQIQVNFETAYTIARAAFLQMQQQGHGRIFLVGAKPGLDAQKGKGMIAYSLSKSLLFRLAELLNEEAINSNIVTSIIVPGTIDTPQNRKAMPAADPATWVTANQIADIICFHCSPQASALRSPVIKAYNNS